MKVTHLVLAMITIGAATTLRLSLLQQSYLTLSMDSDEGQRIALGGYTATMTLALVNEAVRHALVRPAVKLSSEPTPVYHRRILNNWACGHCVTTVLSLLGAVLFRLSLSPTTHHFFTAMFFFHSTCYMMVCIELETTLEPESDGMPPFLVVRVGIVVTMALYIVTYCVYYSFNSQDLATGDAVLWMARFEQAVCYSLLLFWASMLPLFQKRAATITWRSLRGWRSPRWPLAQP